MGIIKNLFKSRDKPLNSLGGSNNVNKIVVLEEGMKYTSISIAPSSVFRNKKISN